MFLFHREWKPVPFVYGEMHDFYEYGERHSFVSAFGDICVCFSMVKQILPITINVVTVVSRYVKIG